MKTKPPRAMNLIEERQHLARHAERVALFPLPSVVLFPGDTIPLQIFEPRYREMTADVLESHRVLVMARFLPGFESDYEGRPPVQSIAGAGIILGSQKLEDGRYILALRGAGRVRIDEEYPPDRSYREVRVSLLEDQPCEDGELEPCLQAIEDIAGGIISTMGPQAQKVWAGIQAEPDLVRRVDRIASGLLPGPSNKQALLESLDPAERAQRLLETLRRISGN